MLKLKNVKLKTKLIGAFLLVSLIPLMVMGISSSITAKKALTAQIMSRLEALEMEKRIQIKRYFQGLFLHTNIFANSQEVGMLYQRLVEYHKKTDVKPDGNYDVTTPEYREIWNTLGKTLRQYQEKSGVYDIFLICARHGHVMYTNAKEADLGENLRHGRFKNSGLAKLWEKVVESRAPAIVDMAPYAPSNGDPAMFLGYPIFDANTLTGVFAVQIPLDQINEVTNTTHGLGKNGEVYLVGPDRLRRSDSILEPEEHSVKNSFAHPEEEKVDIASVQNALAGHHGEGVELNHDGIPVITHYEPLKVMDLTWAVVAEEHVSEAFAPIKKLKITALTVALASLLFIVFFALILARDFSKPIVKSVAFAKAIAGGDLTQTLDIHREDEMGVLGDAMKTMCSDLHQMVGELVQGMNVLSTSSTELSAVSVQMKSGTEETSGKSQTVAAAADQMSGSMVSVAAAIEELSVNIESVSSSAEELSSTISEISENMERARSVTDDAVQRSGRVTERISELGEAARQIGTVTESIAEISEQTNLLALNATIEAARAGQAGKGFAVVATEIKELARQTAEATLQIRDRVEGIRKSTDATVSEVGQITTVINDVHDIVGSVAVSVEEQSNTTREISGHVGEAALGIHEVSDNISQTASASGEVATNIGHISQASMEISASGSQLSQSANELSSLSEQIRGMLNRFTV